MSLSIASAPSSSSGAARPKRPLPFVLQRIPRPIAATNETGTDARAGAPKAAQQQQPPPAAAREASVGDAETSRAPAAAPQQPAAACEESNEIAPAVQSTQELSGVVAPATTTLLSSAARERILAVPKKRKIALMTDTADALKRVESGESAKRPAPAPVRESASGYVQVPTQANGTTPAMRAMHYSQLANSVMKQSHYNIVKHFVVLDKLLQQATVGAIVAETALDLARSGRL